MRVLLLGHPVAHSASPPMQNAGFAALHLPHRYVAVDVMPDAVEGAMREVRGRDCLGANVTVPHKVAVVPFLDELAPTAEMMGAVSTIVTRDGRLTGHNTDVEGAWKGLVAPASATLDGALVVVAGAGGGARAVIGALARTLPRAPTRVVVAARRAAGAQSLAELGSRLGLAIDVAQWSELRTACEGAQVLLNCTPLGLHGEDSFAGVALFGRVVLDLTYAPGGTPVIRRALTEGALQAIQGDQMLLHQGVEGFRLWTGEEPPIEAMRLALAETLA